jgi:subtilisin family serine protease
MGQAAAVFNGMGGYVNQNGTSFATPQIAGWAACLWQAIPSATPYELRQIIIKCATLYNTPSAQQGYGVPDFNCARDIALHVKDSLRVDVSVNLVSVTTNPFLNELDLVLSPYIDQQVDFKVVDLTGKTVYTTSAFFHKGINNPFRISLPDLPSGVYLLKAVSATDQQVLKVVKY